MNEDDIKISEIKPASPAITANQADKTNSHGFNFDFKNPFAGKDGGLKKNKQSLNWFKLVKYIYPLTIVIITVFLCLLMSFLYTNVYLTMTQAALVGSLKARVIEERLNTENFNSIIAKLQDKKTIGDWNGAGNIISPFDFGLRIKLLSSTSTVTSTSPVTSTLQSIILTTTTKTTTTSTTAPTKSTSTKTKK